MVGSTNPSERFAAKKFLKRATSIQVLLGSHLLGGIPDGYHSSLNTRSMTGSEVVWLQIDPDNVHGGWSARSIAEPTNT